MNPPQILKPQGAFTIATAQAHREQLLPLAQAASQAVEIDLSGIDAFDSAGVQLLLAMRRSVTANGGSFALRDTSAVVTEVLAVYGLDALFHRRCVG